MHKLACSLLFFSCLQPLTAQGGGSEPKLRFEISFNESVRSEPTTGRAYLMISRNDGSRSRGRGRRGGRGGPREPRQQIGRTGVPFFGEDIEGLRPGEAAVIDESTLGSPVESLR
ncbi:MAG: hypothetical protein ACYTG5_14960, partial [Planctomycetota bacterium]